MEKIPGLSFQDALEYTTGDNPDAVITVGIIKDGQVSYRVYGENGQELPEGNAYLGNRLPIKEILIVESKSK